jgi:hypothetical protein
MSEKTPPEVVRWYTRARRFPQLIGRTPDGARLWGGPYTITQAVGAGLMLFAGLNTMPLWASFGFVGNLLVLGVATYGVVLLLGRIPVGSRSPLSVAAGAYRAVSSPRHGRLGGKPVRLRRPHRLRHTVVLRLDSLPVTAADRAPAAGPAEAAAARPAASTGCRRTGRRKPDPVPAVPPAPGPAAGCAPARAAGKPALTGVQSLLAGAGRLTGSEAP